MRRRAWRTWSTLTLQRDGGVLRVYEPDFGGEPRAGLSARVDETLSVIRDQTELLRRTGLPGLDARWDAYVILVPRAVLERPNLFLRRVAQPGAGDSGWMIGDADDPPANDAAGQADAVQVYRMLSLRPFLLRLLVLPEGALVRVSGSRVEALTDAAGRDCLRKSR